MKEAGTARDDDDSDHKLDDTSGSNEEVREGRGSTWMRAPSRASTSPTRVSSSQSREEDEEEEEAAEEEEEDDDDKEGEEGSCAGTTKSVAALLSASAPPTPRVCECKSYVNTKAVSLVSPSPSAIGAGVAGACPSGRGDAVVKDAPSAAAVVVAEALIVADCISSSFFFSAFSPSPFSMRVRRRFGNTDRLTRWSSKPA